MTRLARIPAAGLLLLLVAAAGVGWLYLIRGAGALAAGPLVPQALPLEHLAGADAQPLLRLLLVWPALGVAAGAGLALLRVRHVAAWAAVGVVVVLGLAGAASDAVEENQRFVAHIAPQAGRGAIWLAAALVAAGAAAGARLARSGR